MAGDSRKYKPWLIKKISQELPALDSKEISKLNASTLELLYQRISGNPNPYLTFLIETEGIVISQ